MSLASKKSGFESARNIPEIKNKIVESSANNKELDDFETKIFQEIDSGIIESRHKVAWIEKGSKRIKDSKYFYIFNEDFLFRLNQLQGSAKSASEILNKLEEEKKFIELKLPEGKGLDNKDLSRLTKMLTDLEKGLIVLENKLSDIGDQFKITKVERKNQEKRLGVLEDRIKLKIKRGIYSSEVVKKAAKDMLERIEFAKNFSMDDNKISNFENLAERDLFIPEEESDKKLEVVKIFYKISPRLDADKKQLKRASSIFSLIKNEVGIFTDVDYNKILKVGDALDKTVRLNTFLSNADPLHDDFSISQFKDSVQDYNNLILDIIKNTDNIESKTRELLLDKTNNMMSVIEDNNIKNNFSAEQKFMLDGFRLTLKDADIQLEELVEIYNILLKKIFNTGADNEVRQIQDEDLTPVEEDISEVQDEDLTPVEEDISEVQDEDLTPAEEDIIEVQDEDPASIDEDVVELQDTNIIPVEKSVSNAEIITEVSKKEKVIITKSIKELMIENGVVDLNPSDILNRISDEDLNELILGLHKDLKKKSDSNKYDFNNTLRSILTEQLFDDVDKKERNNIIEGMTQDVYSTLFSAVDAEVQKEIANQLSDKATKLAKAGKVGARLAGGIAIAAGAGVGAGLLFSSGGMAMAVTAASIPATRAIMRQLEQLSVYKKAKESSSSFWNNKIGKIFSKNKSDIDTSAIIDESIKKIATKENLSVILSNKLRENTSQDILRAIDSYASSKKDVIKQPSLETSAKFEQSLDAVSKQFYKNSLNYLMMEYANKDVTDEEMSKMAMLMTLNLVQNQRGNVAIENTISKLDSRVDTLEEKGWIVDKMEKFLKVRSKGVGAIVFGSGLAYAIAETSSIARVTSGAVAGAGLGLVVEKKMISNSDKKIIKKVDKLINKSKLQSFNTGAKLSKKDFNKIEKDAAFIQEQLNAGVFEGKENILLKTHAKEFVRMADLRLVELVERDQFDVSKLLSGIEKKTRLLEKNSNLTIKKSSASFKKNRELVFMTVGAAIGGLAGYIGANIADRVQVQELESVINKDNLNMDSHRQLAGVDYQISPENPEEEIIPIINTKENINIGSIQKKPVLSFKDSLDIKDGITQKLEKFDIADESNILIEEPKKIDFNKDDIEDLSWIASSDKNIENTNGTKEMLEDDKMSLEFKDINAPIEVKQLFESSINELDNKNPVYLTIDEKEQFRLLTERGESTEEFLNTAKKQGAVYEDSNGVQYHAGELDFEEDEV